MRVGNPLECYSQRLRNHAGQVCLDYLAHIIQHGESVMMTTTRARNEAHLIPNRLDYLR